MISGSLWSWLSVITLRVLSTFLAFIQNCLRLVLDSVKALCVLSPLLSVVFMDVSRNSHKAGEVSSMEWLKETSLLFADDLVLLTQSKETWPAITEMCKAAGIKIISFKENQGKSKIRVRWLLVEEFKCLGIFMRIFIEIVTFGTVL